MRTVRRLGGMLAGAGLLAILALTLKPNPRQSGISGLTPLLCLVCGESGGVDVVLNLLLFMPMAAGLALTGWPWARIVAACALTSLVVESLQYLPFTGRDASLSDVLTNTGGGALAAALAARYRRILAPGPVLAQRLALGATAAWLAMLAFTSFAMQPWVPDGQLRNYCTAGFPTPEIFAGTARAMTLNGVTLACDRAVPGAEAIRDQLHRGAIALQVVAESGRPKAPKRIIHVVRAPHASVVTLIQHRRSLVFQAPTNALRLRLHPPLIRLSDAFPDRAGLPVALTADLRDRRMTVSATHDGGRGSQELPLSPAQGWTLLSRATEQGVPPRLAGALWLGALLLPAAYWTRLTARPARTLVAVAGAVVAGLAVLPRLTGFHPSHWSEWLGAGAGVALGWALPRIAAYLQSRCASPSTSAYSSS
jgi:VanZ like family